MTVALRRSGIDMVHFITSLNRAGTDVFVQAGPVAHLPAGVTPYNGWANRLLFAASYLWLILAARALRRHDF